MLLGNKIKSLRDEQGILQRQVAAYLEIDTPMFSKIEREEQYTAALKRVEELMLQLPEGTPDSDPDMKELTMLGNLVADYEEEHFPIDN